MSAGAKRIPGWVIFLSLVVVVFSSTFVLLALRGGLLPAVIYGGIVVAVIVLTKSAWQPSSSDRVSTLKLLTAAAAAFPTALLAKPSLPTTFAQGARSIGLPDSIATSNYLVAFVAALYYSSLLA